MGEDSFAARQHARVQEAAVCRSDALAARSAAARAQARRLPREWRGDAAARKTSDDGVASRYVRRYAPILLPSPPLLFIISHAFDFLRLIMLTRDGALTYLRFAPVCGAVPRTL